MGTSLLSRAARTDQSAVSRRNRRPDHRFLSSPLALPVRAWSCAWRARLPHVGSVPDLIYALGTDPDSVEVVGGKHPHVLLGDDGVAVPTVWHAVTLSNVAARGEAR